MSRVEEQRLIALAQRGDADAFAELYRANVQAIYRYIAHRVNDPQLAEDITGDVFIRALEALSSYQEQGRPFIAWLYRVAHARVVDYYRRTGRRPIETDLDDEEPTPVVTDLDTAMIRRQAAAALREAITHLTGDQQQVVILRFIEGYRIEMVAQIMGKQPNAVKALQHRALRALAGRLQRSGFDIENVIAGLS